MGGCRGATNKHSRKGGFRIVETAIEVLKKELPGMTVAEEQEALHICSGRSAADVWAAVQKARRYQSAPTWAYVMRVLAGMRRRLTMADYASFSEATKGKLDRFPFAWTGLESDLSEMPAWARRAVEGVERQNMSERGQG